MWTELRLRPWWKAPLLLLRRPGVMVALAAAALVTAVPAAGTPLFLSASQSASIARQVDNNCLADNGARAVWRFSGPDRPLADRQAATANRAAAEVDNLDGDAGRRTLVSAQPRASWQVDRRPSIDPITVGLTGPDGRPWGVRLASRADAVKHLEVLAGHPSSSGRGIWVSDQLADGLDLAVGDELAFDAVPDPDNPDTEPDRVRAPVVGIYRDLRTGTVPAELCELRPVLHPDGLPGSGFPPTVFTDAETFWQVIDRAQGSVAHVVAFPLADRTPSRELAGTTVAGLDRFRAAIGHSATSSADNEYGDVFVGFHSDLARFVQRADLVDSSMRLPITAVSGAAILVGLFVVGVAALLWTRRRHRELAVLVGYGTGPAAIGVKAVAEAAPAVGIGTAAGWLLVERLMAAVGPSRVVTGAAVGESIRNAVAVGLVALVVVGVVAGLRARGLADAAAPARHRRLGTAVPWELGLLAAAVVAWRWMDDRTVATEDGLIGIGVGVVVQLPGRWFVAPLLGTVAVAVLAARLAGHWLRSRALAAAPDGAGRFIGWRRIAREPVVAVAVAAAVAVPVALAGYSAVVTESINASVGARAKAGVGADVVVYPPEPDAAVPAALAAAGQLTEVVRVDRVRLGRSTSSALFVDPDTFLEVADLAERLAGRPLGDIWSAGSGPVAVIGGSTVLTDGPHRMTGQAGIDLDVQVVTVPALPAPRGGFPVALLPMAYAPDVQSDLVERQWWVRTSDPERVAGIATAALGRDIRVDVAARRFDGTSYEPVTQTFSYLTLVSVLTAAVVVVGLLLHVESRTVAHRRAYALLRRMNLRPRTHRAALGWELGAVLGAGAVAGLAIAAGTVWLLSDAFDLEPGRLPDAYIAVPAGPFAVIAVAAAVVAAAATWFAHVRIARAVPSEVLRATD